MIAEVESEAARLEAAIASWDHRFQELSDRLRLSSIELANAASGSWTGYQSTVYYEGFKMPPAGAEFDTFSGVGSPRGAWRQYTYPAFLDELVQRAATSTDALDPLATEAAKVTLVLMAVRDEVTSSLDALLAAGPDRRLEELRGKLAEVQPVLSQTAIIAERAPKQIRSADMRAVNAGVQTPFHIYFQSWLMEATLRLDRARQVTAIARTLVSYLKKKEAMMASTPTPGARGKVFIGHGGALVWRDSRTSWLSD